MRYRISEVKTDIDIPMDKLPGIIARKAGIRASDISEWEIRRRSIDSRKKPHIQYVYTVDFITEINLAASSGAGGAAGSTGKKNGRNRYQGRKPRIIPGLTVVDESREKVTPPATGDRTLTGRPVVIGMGPCGLFAGLELARLGYRPIIIERGPAMSERIDDVERFRREHILNPESNMLFGEGGAGTFSDGKIGTGIKDSLIRQVLTEFRDAGAGDDIMYLAKPHIGTDVLRNVIVNIRNKIIALGGEVWFNTRLDELVISDGALTGIKISSTRASDNNTGCDVPGECAGSGVSMPCEIATDALILAIGHSARDTFAVVNESGLDMEQKPFSIGVRMEHPQSMIDAAQYGIENVGMLPPADYKINYRASNGRGVYSFCMCPGGEVVVCTTSEGEVCVNGMSNRSRDSGVANSGILCDVRTSDFGSDDVLAGVRYQEKYERLAFVNGGGDFSAPKCSMEDFLAGASDASCRVTDSLPAFAAEAIREAVPDFARKIHGYDDPSAVVTAVETRSSSPVRILRDDTGQSNIRGIYPAGEGAGYAGGITSAACDGIRAAWHIVEQYRRPE